MVIPLSRTVKYCAVGGTTRPMTYARAMASEKRGGEVVSIADNTIPLGVSLIGPTSFFYFFLLRRQTVARRGTPDTVARIRSLAASPELLSIYDTLYISSLPSGDKKKIKHLLGASSHTCS